MDTTKIIESKYKLACIVWQKEPISVKVSLLDDKQCLICKKHTKYKKNNIKLL